MPYFTSRHKYSIPLRSSNKEGLIIAEEHYSLVEGQKLLLYYLEVFSVQLKETTSGGR